MEYVTLNNGIKMPMLGYGTFLTPVNETKDLVAKAIKVGYRFIDTAQNYQNESGVGAAIRESGLPREEFFVTSKTQTNGFEATKRGIEQSLQEFGFDYIDMMIIHWPSSDSLGTYRALEEAYREGKIRAIGLSNFNSRDLEQLLPNIDIKPVVDQIETHVFWQQKKMAAVLKNNNILHESWSPLGKGAGQLIANDTLQEIGEKYQKLPTQIALRFLVQQGIPVIPKASSVEHMKSNSDIFDFSLSDEEMKIISDLDLRQSVIGWPQSMQIERDY